MFIAPYDTTAISTYNLQTTLRELRVAKINGDLRVVRNSAGERLEGVLEVPPYVKSVPAFGHPICLGGGDESDWIIDTRAFVSPRESEQTVIVGTADYRFLTLRALLSRAWADGDTTSFLSTGDLAPTLYISLIAEGLSRRLALSPLEQMPLSAITALYYYLQFERTPPESETFKNLLATKVSRITRIPPARVFEILDQVQYPMDLSSYCEQVKVLVDNPKLHGLTPALIYTAVGGIWFGANAREVTAVALEYPPYLHAMLYTCLTSSAYSRSLFGAAVKRFDRRELGKNLVQAINPLLRTGAHA